MGKTVGSGKRKVSSFLGQGLKVWKQKRRPLNLNELRKKIIKDLAGEEDEQDM